MRSIAWSKAIVLSLALAAPAFAASGRLTDGEVRGFVARQEAAWNRRDLDAYFATFTRDAVFVAQTRTPKGEAILYGRSGLAAAKAQSKRYFAKARSVDRSLIDRVVLAADGKSARVLGRKISRSEVAGRPQVVCARTDQTVVTGPGGMRSRGQTDTTVRCQDAGLSPR